MSARVFVVHQDIPFEAIAARVREHQGHALVVTNHSMFKEEREALLALCGKDVEIVEECRFFGQEDCLRIDRAVWDAQEDPNAKDYISRIREARATHLEARLSERLGSGIEFFHGEGLGIPGDWWKARGSTCIGCSELELEAPSRPPKGLLARWHQWVATRPWVRCMGEDGFVLGGRLARIQGRLRGPVEQGRPTLRERLRYGFPDRTRTWPTPRRSFALPWHEYAPCPGRRTLVLQDGHFPRDYTASVLLTLRRGDPLVPSNPFSEAWARACGWEVERLAGFSDPDFLPVESGCPEGRTQVLLALNHAGDWSPFIHRSDTDMLVEAVLEMASREPWLCVRVRPHPTMNHSEHEGRSSIERLRRHVQGHGKENLEFSIGSLDEDLQWADVVVSEYSQVLIDAWRLGMPGISFNPTDRRSFVQEYADLGFSQVADAEALLQLLRDLPGLAESQGRAVSAYNRVMADWRSQPTAVLPSGERLSVLCGRST